MIESALIHGKIRKSTGTWMSGMRRREGMAILVFDIGGTAVKYGVWENDTLTRKHRFSTPKTWEEMKQTLLQVKKEVEKDTKIDGAAFSSPGAVNQEKRVIEGASAVPYLHSFPIYAELEEAFGCPVSFENDANSAALAEIWKGAARGLKSVLLVVVGSGIGGSIVMNGEVQHGKHLFGGEFGFALMAETETFSDLGTAVGMARRYCRRKGLAEDAVSGEEVFQLAEEGDAVAQEEAETFYYYLSKGIFNLQYSFDPERILIGGGVSNKPDLLEKLDEQFDKILDVVQIAPFKPEVAVCTFQNDANLVGAVYNFLKKRNERRENLR